MRNKPSLCSQLFEGCYWRKFTDFIINVLYMSNNHHDFMLAYFFNSSTLGPLKDNYGIFSFQVVYFPVFEGLKFH